jgi:hypothetical protein
VGERGLDDEAEAPKAPSYGRSRARSREDIQESVHIEPLDARFDSALKPTARRGFVRGRRQESEIDAPYGFCFSCRQEKLRAVAAHGEPAASHAVWM